MRTNHNIIGLNYLELQGKIAAKKPLEFQVITWQQMEDDHSRAMIEDQFGGQAEETTK